LLALPRLIFTTKEGVVGVFSIRRPANCPTIPWVRTNANVQIYCNFKEIQTVEVWIGTLVSDQKLASLDYLLLDNGVAEENEKKWPNNITSFRRNTKPVMFCLYISLQRGNSKFIMRTDPFYISSKETCVQKLILRQVIFKTNSNNKILLFSNSETVPSIGKLYFIRESNTHMQVRTLYLEKKNFFDTMTSRLQTCKTYSPVEDYMDGYKF
jgi:hypothetical protein